jgi:hypothetical protein
MKNSLIFLLPVVFLLNLNNPVSPSGSEFQKDNIMVSDTTKKGGIVFFRSKNLSTLEDFYVEKIGC